MRVLKFGGAALRDGPAIRQAVQIVQQKGGEGPVVVVSAHAGVTEHLRRALARPAEARQHWDTIRIRHRTLLHQLGLPQELLDRHLRELMGLLDGIGAGSGPQKRLRDHVLSFGERMSARVFAAALRAAGLRAVPLDAFDLGLVSDGGQLCSPASGAREVRAAIAGLRGIPVVTGFLALDREGYLTTLGSSGSDLTAAWLGAALGAQSIDLWKQVSGLMRADPRLIPGAEHLIELNWCESEELARHGAAALHAGAVEPAREAGIPIHLRSLDDPSGPGTLIWEHPGCALRSGPLALAQRLDLGHIRLPFEAGRPNVGKLAEFFAFLSSHGLEPYLGMLGDSDFQVLVSLAGEGPRLEENLPAGAELQLGLGTISIIGRRLGDHPGLGETLGECLDTGALLLRSWGGVDRFGATSSEPGEIESRVLLLPSSELPAMLQRLYGRFFSPLDRKKPVS